MCEAVRPWHDLSTSFVALTDLNISLSLSCANNQTHTGDQGEKRGGTEALIDSVGSCCEGVCAVVVWKGRGGAAEEKETRDSACQKKETRTKKPIVLKP